MPRILVADPFPETRELLERAVARLGYEIVRVNDPRENLAGAVIEPVSPETLELAHELRREDPGLPIVFATIAPRTAALRAFDSAAFLQKPFRLAQLADALGARVSSRARPAA